MRNVGRIAVAGLLAAMAAGCGKAPESPPAESPSAAASPVVSAAASGQPASFAICTACHSVEPGKNGLGPSLHGVVGRKAGTLPGFAYSAAMKADGRTWDAASLDTYLEAPMVALPGNKMSFAGLKDAAKRTDVIAYLATLK